MNSTTSLSNELLSLVPKDKKVLFVCIGTDRSTGDSLGPLVGTFLKQQGYEVLGTLDDPVHAMNIHYTLDSIKQKYSDHFVVAVDASLGQLSSVGKVSLGKGPLKPGAGVGKDLTPVGDAHITGVVNVGGFMEYFVLQNTRLAFVLKMAEEIAVTCIDVQRKIAKKRGRRPKLKLLMGGTSL